MILIIANARWKGGLSGSDNIYLNFRRYWKDRIYIYEMQNVDFKPFWLAYLNRIMLGCFVALFDKNKYEFVYTSSDFWMDTFPGFIYKLKGCKWVASFYLFAPKDNKIYYYSQKIAYWIIKLFADVVCVTNESMFDKFKGKKLIAVHGGVNFEKIPRGNFKKEYDCVFIGRFHKTKGIDELMKIWGLVSDIMPEARLAIIGGGDSEEEKLSQWAAWHDNVDLLGYMGDERFEIYKKSKLVLYTTPVEYSHFSMGSVEAMACGCPMIMFRLPVLQYFKRIKGVSACKDTEQFARTIIYALDNPQEVQKEGEQAKQWAKTWDWKKRAPEVLRQIRRYL